MIGNAVHGMRIATGEVEEKLGPPDAANEYMRLGGLKGGKARAKVAQSGKAEDDCAEGGGS